MTLKALKLTFLTVLTGALIGLVTGIAFVWLYDGSVDWAYFFSHFQ